MTSVQEELAAALPVRDFLLYVTSTRTMLKVIPESAYFSLHVASVMRSSPVNPNERFEETSVGYMSESLQREIDNEFPLLFANALIGLWGALEACINDLCLLWLQCMDRHSLGQALASARVKIGDYLRLDDEDRWQWLLVQLQRSDAASLRKGIGQFESMLKPLGVSPQVDSAVRTTLFRIKTLRNLYAHRAGIADAKFLQEWKGHPADVGQLVVPTKNQIVAGYTAMVIYVESVHDSMQVKIGGSPAQRDLPPWIESVKDLVSMLEPSANVPEGAPWSYHFSRSVDDPEQGHNDNPS
ncbi:hypothetical protein [Bifidobacterium psychraerophilum]|uniref:Mce-related protein n=1 Tax=Bifidobacterium psychraerophilum TaxID=218140 RepID=A0A087CCP0_9BIFI|nr:hypothetical protein [Bifidobacterium psychraerophilum]KFI81040.1 mce-related protein [Bifidobacterium psychraerophilum]PKA95387.1 hypothetical protein A9A89_1651 [Bifidobacterium psychraerophilum DSM 22366]